MLAICRLPYEGDVYGSIISNIYVNEKKINMKYLYQYEMIYDINKKCVLNENEKGIKI